MTFDFICAVEI